MATASRKTIEVERRRVPLKKLLHGKEIREAAAALEEFRLKMNEAEFLYGARIVLQMGEYNECHAVAKRLETDKEYADRLEAARLAAEAKKEREIKRKAEVEAKALRAQEEQRLKAVEYVKSMVKEHKISTDDLVDVLVK